jgi:hypothetical protein
LQTLNYFIMKKITTTTLAAIVILLFSFSGCEKLHRSDYTGRWDFTVVYAIWKEDSGWDKDTTYYLGKITRGAAYNKLKIEYLENTTIIMEINEWGELVKEFKDPHAAAYGEFAGQNRVHIDIHNEGGGLGCYSGYTIDGAKRKRGGKHE